MAKTRAHLIIHGLVQGVFFRDSTRRKANGLGLTGWVRNRPEGTVEIVAEGPEGEMERFISWCHRGPSGADVSRVEEAREDYRGEFDSFDIAY